MSSLPETHARLEGLAVTRKQRRDEQATVAREWNRQQQERQERHMPLPKEGTPEYCPWNMRSHRHWFVKGRCLHCYQTRGDLCR